MSKLEDHGAVAGTANFVHVIWPVQFFYIHVSEKEKSQIVILLPANECAITYCNRM